MELGKAELKSDVTINSGKTRTYEYQTKLVASLSKIPREHIAFIMLGSITSILPFFYFNKNKYNIQNIQLSTTTGIWCMLILTFIFSMNMFPEKDAILQMSFHTVLTLLICYFTMLLFLQSTTKEKIERRLKLNGPDDKFFNLVRTNGAISIITIMIVFIMFFMRDMRIFVGTAMLATTMIIGKFFIFSRLVRIITKQTTDG
jgi:hypothetical protein